MSDDDQTRALTEIVLGIRRPIDGQPPTSGRVHPIDPEMYGTYHPPERDVLRLAFRNPDTGGYTRWGYASSDGMMIMNDDGEVYVRIDESTLDASPEDRRLLYAWQTSRDPMEQEERIEAMGLVIRGMLKSGFLRRVTSRIALWLCTGRY